jgi:hypothetical protein
MILLPFIFSILTKFFTILIFSTIIKNVRGYMHGTTDQGFIHLIIQRCNNLD